MEPKYELTDNPPPDAFQKMWSPLLKFNEHAVGDANARTLAILLKDPTTDELIGGLWGAHFGAPCSLTSCSFRSHCEETGSAHHSCDRLNRKRSGEGVGIFGRKPTLSKHGRFTKSWALPSSVVWTAPRRSSLASSSRRISATLVDASSGPSSWPRTALIRMTGDITKSRCDRWRGKSRQRRRPRLLSSLRIHGIQ